MVKPLVLFLFTTINLASFGQGPIDVDRRLDGYQKAGGVSGSIHGVGSDTLNNLMALWSESFRRTYPNVMIQVEGKGSSTAPPALMEGVAQLGLMSRPMKKDEIDQFEDKLGYKPTSIWVALDALAVYVNKDNPLEQLTLPQLDAIFSKTRKSGYPHAVITWGQLGVEGDLEPRPISLYGRNSASGTYGFFKQRALFKGDFKDRVKEQPGSASVVMGVTEDLSGIGYSGIGYKTSGVKTIKLAKNQQGHAFEANADTIISGSYPLGRVLFIYLAIPPNEAPPLVVREFLKFILSRDGQEIVVKSGHIPLPARVADMQADLFKS